MYGRSGIVGELGVEIFTVKADLLEIVRIHSFVLYFVASTYMDINVLYRDTCMTTCVDPYNVCISNWPQCIQSIASPI